MTLTMFQRKLQKRIDAFETHLEYLRVDYQTAVDNNVSQIRINKIRKQISQTRDEQLVFIHLLNDSKTIDILD